MKLEGIVTNVTAFGAFVDIGVHQDGLVHVSQLADRFVNDPNEVVTVGQRVKVRVMEVDLQRNRIALTMKSAQGGDARPRGGGGRMLRRAPGRVRRRVHQRTRRTGAPGRPAPAPAAKPFTPKPGAIAPNGMRFR